MKTGDYYKYVVGERFGCYFGTDDIKEARAVAKADNTKVYRLDTVTGHKIREIKIERRIRS